MNASVTLDPTETRTAVAAVVAAIALSALPPVGQPLEGGTFAGLTTLKDGSHCAVVLLDARPSKRLSWDRAPAWAAENGGELPSRPVSALLFALFKPKFDPTWYWTSELDEDDSESYAWYCSFINGNQFYLNRSAEGSAVAVRLIPLSA